MVLPSDQSKPFGDVILVLDDEPDFLTLTCGYLARAGFETLRATRVPEARELLNQHFVDLLLIDERLDLDGRSGTGFLDELRALQPGLGGIVVSADADLQLAQRAMRAGAVDIIAKPADENHVLQAIRRALQNTAPARETRRNRWFAQRASRPPEIVGDSEAIRSILQIVGQVADSDASVLIQGESGTGKELIAKAIHAASPRRSKEMIAVNMAGIPPEMIEAELFGATKGSYTGAIVDRRGYFLEADGTTLFLDEIGEAPAAVQVRLLRALEDGTITRVGESRSRKVNVRVVAATNRDLQKEMAERRFREDLFYRLNVVPLKTTPLRDRPDDIEPIARHALAQFARKMGRPARGFEPAALEALRRYSWPGNARELRNVVQHAVLLSKDEILKRADLHLGPGDPNVAEWSELLEMPLKQAVEGFERRYFQWLMVRASGNKTIAKDLAGCDRKTIYAYLEKLGLDAEQP